MEKLEVGPPRLPGNHKETETTPMNPTIDCTRTNAPLTALPTTTRKVSRLQKAAERGFTLIELLIVMSVMLILLTLAVPQLLKVRKSANETSATQSLAAIAQAELQYNSAYPQLGYTCTISELGGDPKSGAPTPQSSQLLQADLATGQKAGYTFTITNCNKVTVNNQDMLTSFEATAVPQSLGKTGDNGYCIDENHTIRKDPTGGTNCTQPIQ